MGIRRGTAVEAPPNALLAEMGRRRDVSATPQHLGLWRKSWRASASTPLPRYRTRGAAGSSPADRPPPTRAARPQMKLPSAPPTIQRASSTAGPRRCSINDFRRARLHGHRLTKSCQQWCRTPRCPSSCCAKEGPEVSTLGHRHVRGVKERRQRGTHRSPIQSGFRNWTTRSTSS